jgi:hypothetical protein
VLSEQLHYLNRHICENLACTDTHPNYKPHITIAYVKRGLGETYAQKLNALKGHVVAFDRLIFSDKSRRHVSIPLVGPAKYARRRQVRSTAGQQPLPSMGDANKKQHHLWREELHPRESSGQFAEKGGGGLPHQFGQGMLFHELASKLHHAETSIDPHVKSSQQDLFQQLASADVPPEQLAALLSGDQERLDALRNHAHATGQAEMPAQSSQSSGVPGDDDAFSLDPEMGTPMNLNSRIAPGDLDPQLEAGRREALAGIREGAARRASGDREPRSDVRLVGRNIAPGTVQPPPSLSEPSKPLAGMPGGSLSDDGGGSNPSSDAAAGGFSNPPAGDDARSRESEGGFELQQQPKKIGRGIGTEDKTPEISKGRQNAFFHGLNDAPGQEKLFEGLDLAGSDSGSESSEPKTGKPPVPAAALPPEPKKKKTETSKEKRLRSLTGGHKAEGKPSLDQALTPEQRIARHKRALKYLTTDGAFNRTAMHELLAGAYATNSTLEGALAEVQKSAGSNWKRKLTRAAIEADLGFLYRKHG